MKDFVTKKMEKTDFFNIENSEKSPHIINCLKRCPATSVTIERSFSLLGKIARSERRFKGDNLKKYAIFYYNRNNIGDLTQ